MPAPTVGGGIKQCCDMSVCLSVCLTPIAQQRCSLQLCLL